MLRRLNSLAAAVLLLVTLTGCGLYSFSGSSLPPHIKTIAVPIFDNESQEFAVANEATEGVTQRFLQDNRLKVVGEGRADCVLEGTIRSYENKVYNYSADQQPEDYIVVIRFAAVLRDAVKNRELWKDEAISVSAVYSVASSAPGALADEPAARAKAIRDLAEDILARTMEQW